MSEAFEALRRLLEVDRRSGGQRHGRAGEIGNIQDRGEPTLLIGDEPAPQPGAVHAHQRRDLSAVAGLSAGRQIEGMEALEVGMLALLVGRCGLHICVFRDGEHRSSP